MNVHRLPRAVAAALLLIVLAALAGGCGSSDKKSATAGSAGGNSTDAGFVMDMTKHHESAITMAKIAEKRADHPEIRKLAGDIISAQQSEIAVMKRIGDDMESMGMNHSGHMGMSDAEMGMSMYPSMLEDAKPFDKGFIDMMVPHHQGAVKMAKEELTKGSDPTLRKMASSIISSQTREIDEMRAWRKQWYGSAAASMSG